MASIKYSLNPDLKTVNKRFRERIQNMKGTDVPFRQCAVFLDRWVQQNFKEDGGKVGGWEPLAAGGRWVGRKGARWFDGSAKVLRDTGRLKNSFLPYANKNNAGIRNDVPYAAKHEFGQDGLPVRRMLPKKREIMPDIMDIFNRYVKKSMKVAGSRNV